jgi:hypothetical protein
MRDLAAIYREQRRFSEAHAIVTEVLRAVTAHESSGQPMLGLSPASLKQELAGLARGARPAEPLQPGRK